MTAEIKYTTIRIELGTLKKLKSIYAEKGITYDWMINDLISSYTYSFEILNKNKIRNLGGTKNEKTRNEKK